jgi:uncharacterized protein
MGLRPPHQQDSSAQRIRLTIVPNLGTIVPIMGLLSEPPASSAGAALFGATRQAVLRTLFGHCDKRFYLRQIIRSVGLGSGTVQRELAGLTRAGIVTRTVEGAQNYYQANRECPVFDELRGLIRKTFGVADILQTALQPLGESVRLAFLYGSLANGKETEASDIDVLVVGDRITLDDVVLAFAGSQRELGREINPSVYRTEDLCRRLAEGQHFLSSVIAGPKVFLIGDDGELSRLAKVRVAQDVQDKPGGNRRSARRSGS